MTTVRRDEKSWQAGHAAGLQGKRDKCPADVADELAWQSGYIEGKAERDAQRRRAAKQLKDR